MITATPNFLTESECKRLIKLIDENNSKSLLAGKNNNDAIRNSSTCLLASNRPLVRDILLRIANKLNFPFSHGEFLQGQMYQPGQYFKEHTDYFNDKLLYLRYCQQSGNRQHTLMIYLNEDLTGGQTTFKLQNKTFNPQTGLALDWANMKDGKFLPDSLHEGTEVESGKKYIITSWWREKPFNPRGDNMLFKAWKQKEKGA